MYFALLRPTKKFRIESKYWKGAHGSRRTAHSRYVSYGHFTQLSFVLREWVSWSRYSIEWETKPWSHFTVFNPFSYTSYIFVCSNRGNMEVTSILLQSDMTPCLRLNSHDGLGLLHSDCLVWSTTLFVNQPCRSWLFYVCRVKNLWINNTSIIFSKLSSTPLLSSPSLLQICPL